MSSFYTIEDSLHISNNGNVGIGITNPSKTFEVVGDIDSTTDYNINGTRVLSATTLGSSVVSSSLQNLGTQDAALNMGSQNITSVADISAANVNASSNADINGTLDVAGASQLQSLNVTADSSFSGNVGVGITNPQFELDVSGDINLTGALKIAGVAQSFGISQEQVEDYVNGLVVAGSNITKTYDDAAGTLTIASTDTNTQLTQEQVEDYINDLVVAGSNITKTYDDAAGTLTIAATSASVWSESSSIASYAGKVSFGTSDASYLAAPDNGNNGSAGQRIILWPGSASQPPYGFGMNGSTLWYSAPSAAGHRFYTGTTHKATINANGLGIGTSNPECLLHISSGATGDCVLFLQSDTDNNNDADNPRILFGQGAQTLSNADAAIGKGYENDNELFLSNGDGDIVFYTNGSNWSNGTERIRISKTSGNVGIGTMSAVSRLHVKAQNNDPVGNIDVLSDRAITIEGANSTETWGLGMNNTSNEFIFTYGLEQKGYLNNEGNVAQIDFTGQHRTQFSVNNGDIIVNISNYMGLIVSSTGEYCGNKEMNEAIPCIALANTNNDKKVFGVISDAEDPNSTSRKFLLGTFGTVIPKEEGDDRVIINSLGEGCIWVCDVNGALENGDYITTTEFAYGYGVKQDDDLLHNYTVAKITEDEDFSDMTDGKVLENGIKCKFVGCTYHCG